MKLLALFFIFFLKETYLIILTVCGFYVLCLKLKCQLY